MEAVSDVLRFEVAKFGISVVIIEPGLVALEYGRAALSGLQGDDTGPYIGFTASVRAGLEQSFSGGVAGTSTVGEVASTIVTAATGSEPRSRYVVGDMAQQLIGMRQQMDDHERDAFMATMYTQPGPTVKDSPSRSVET